MKKLDMNITDSFRDGHSDLRDMTNANNNIYTN